MGGGGGGGDVGGGLKLISPLVPLFMRALGGLKPMSQTTPPRPTPPHPTPPHTTPPHPHTAPPHPMPPRPFLLLDGELGVRGPLDYESDDGEPLVPLLVWVLGA